VTPLDLTDPTVVADPYPSFARAREVAPVQWHEGLGLWLAFTHAESNAVLRDRRLGRIWRDKEPGERFESFNLIHRNAILEMEPPHHTRLRRLISTAFARGHVERLRPWVEELAGRLVDGLVERSGGSEPVDLLRPWSNAIVKMYEYDRTPQREDDAERAADEFVAYLRALAAERRKAPGDDLVSHLVSVRDAEGDRLTEDELVTTCILLLNAGHEATVNVTGNGTLALLRNPDQLARLREDRALLPTAIEELMRYDSPLQLFERTATEDVEIGGVTVAAGQKIAALLGSANHDPAVFADPETLDVGRSDNPHISFGAGVHFCIGAPLARVELQASFGALLDRTSSLELGGEPVRRPEFVIRGLADLPVVLTA
jgi:cytochrome P450